MTKFDALPAKYGFMVGAIKMLHSVLMTLTEFLSHLLLILIVEIKVAICKLSVFFDDLVQDVDIERESLGTIQLFD